MLVNFLRKKFMKLILTLILIFGMSNTIEATGLSVKKNTVFLGSVLDMQESEIKEAKVIVSPVTFHSPHNPSECDLILSGCSVSTTDNLRISKLLEVLKFIPIHVVGKKKYEKL